MNDVSTRTALKNHQNIRKCIRVMEFLPILSSSACVKKAYVDSEN